MSFINTKAGEIGVKIVYFGPALAGKSTNIRLIHRKTRPALRGRLDAIAGGPEPMLAFDFAPDTIPRIDNRFQVRLHLVTVPGPVLSPASRKLVLKGVDAIAFIADTQEESGELTRFDENVETMELMMAQLEELGVDTAVMPLVIQYNKRDMTEPGPALSDTLPPHCRPVVFSPLDALNEALNPNDVPCVPAIAHQGVGVMDTLRTLVKQLLEPLRAEYEASGDQWPLASNSGRWPRH